MLSVAVHATRPVARAAAARRARIFPASARSHAPLPRDARRAREPGIFPASDNHARRLYRLINLEKVLV